MKLLLTVSLALLGLAASAASVPKVTLYYNSLSTYCKSEFMKQLVPTFEKLGSHINIELVPFGNSRIQKDSHGQEKVICLHGEAECHGNRVHACGLAHIKDTKIAFEFVKCNFAATNWKETAVVGPHCAEQLKQAWAPIKACVDGPEADKLIDANAKKTNALVPRHTGVPWLTINDVHTDAIQVGARNHLMAFLCTKYLAHESIPACKGL